MGRSITEILRQIKKDKKFREYNLQNKIKPHNSPLLRELGKKKFSRDEVNKEIAQIYAKYKSESMIHKKLKEKFGLNVAQRAEVLKTLKGREMTVKDLIQKGLTKDMAQKVFELSKGKVLDRDEIKKMQKIIRGREKRNVFLTAKSREEDELRAQGKLRPSGVSAQDFNKRNVGVSDGASGGISASPVPRSGGVLNQGSGASSIASGIGVKKTDLNKGSNLAKPSSAKPSVPLGF